MAAFPKLKTSAVAQYPAVRSVEFPNQVLRFVDGREQRYRESAGGLHRWEIRLAALDETEMAKLGTFFEDNQGRLGSFAFTDPWDGTVYVDCSLADDAVELTSAAEMRGATSLTVVENRS